MLPCADSVRSGRVRLWIIVTLLSLRLSVFGGTRAPLPYRIEAWTAEDGLPQSSVTAIVQSRDDYIWLGTFGGLTRFDGSKFKVFDTRSTRLPSSRVLSLFEDRNGALWIGSEDGLLTRSIAGRVDVFSPPNLGTVSRFIKAFAETPEGTLWMVSAEGQLIRFQGGQFTIASTNWGLQGIKAQEIVADRSGRLWIGTEKELAFWEHGQFVTAWDQKSQSELAVDGLAVSRKGGLWVAANDRLRKFNHDKWELDYGAYPWSKGVLSQMREDRHGQLWLGVYGSGLFRYATNGALLELSRTEGLPGNLVRSLLEDREGNIWAGTEGHGLARVKPAIFRSYGREQGLSSDLILTVCEGADGELWIGTNGEGINRLKDGVVRHYGAREGLTNECVWSVCQDRKGTLWAGTCGGGLFRMEGERFAPVGPECLCGPVVFGLYEASNGSLLVGQIRNGPEVLMLRNCTPALVKLPARLPAVDTRAMVEDTRGNLWIGTRGDGLYRLGEGQATRFGKAEGLISEFILSLYADSEGTIWIGTREGLYRLHNAKFHVFTSKDGLPDDAIVYIVEDNRRNLWCGSGKGVFRVSKDELNRKARGEGQSIHCFGYTRVDGLPSLECSGGCQPAGCKTRDGRLWFPTVNGLAVVDPDNIPVNPLPPRVIIDEVLIEGETQNSVFTVLPLAEAGAQQAETTPPPATRLRIPSGRERFEFHYTGLSLTAPEKVRFKYKLEGLEKDWVEAGNLRTAHYSYLRPGNYLFHVQACNNDGIWNETGASLELIILPHFWQTWWFRVLTVTTLLLLFVSAYEVRLALERRLTRLRLRIARDLHDEVGSNLGTIALLSEVLAKQHPAPAEELTEIRRVASQTIDSLRDIVWFLDPAVDQMSELVLRMKETAGTILRGHVSQFSSSGESGAPGPSLDFRRNIFLMFKEILHNILCHARAKRVDIAVQITPREFLLTVRDDGIGFDERAVLRGNGLKNLRRRAAELGGRIEIETAPSAGTIISVRAPIP